MSQTWVSFVIWLTVLVSMYFQSMKVNGERFYLLLYSIPLRTILLSPHNVSLLFRWISHSIIKRKQIKWIGKFKGKIVFIWILYLIICVCMTDEPKASETHKLLPKFFSTMLEVVYVVFWNQFVTWISYRFIKRRWLELFNFVVFKFYLY